MIRNEPSDRQDRRIQRKKMRRMWASLADEQARLETLPVFTRRQRHYIGRDYVDVTAEFDQVMIWVIGAFVLLGFVLVATV